MTKRNLVPGAQNKLNSFKLEVANEIGLSDYANMDKGNLTSKENGSVGGYMVKHMVEEYEKNL